MELRDITNEFSLLKSYKTVYVDNQKYELVKLYRDKAAKFPIFTERVFTKSAAFPVEFLDYKYREKVADVETGKMFVLERTDNPKDARKIRLFMVWVSHKLLARFQNTPAESCEVNASVIFHPVGKLSEYPAYWKGGIDPPAKLNFLQLGFRYLCQEKPSVLQHLCALGPVGSGRSTSLTDKEAKLEMMVVIPVASLAAYSNLTDPVELEDALQEIAKRCYEGAGLPRMVGARSPTIRRVAVSGYSRSGILLHALLDNAKKNEPFMRNRLKEIYAFDIMLEVTENGKITKTRRQVYEEFWPKLKVWQGDDSSKKIRLYSSEPATVSGIYAEFVESLKKYGGGYYNPAVAFTGFNGQKMPDGSLKFDGLTNGYEIYSTDNSRSLAVLPFNNFKMYLSSDIITEIIQNINGFQPGGDYEPGLEGHSWFLSRLLSHALFHSEF